MSSLEALTAKSSKLRRVCKKYNPAKFTAELLAMNKDEWLKDVDNTYNDVLNYVEEIESQPGNAGINGTEVENIVDSATESLQQFLIDFNHKCGLGLASANTATIGSESNLAQKTKAAQIDVRINGEKVEDFAKKLRSAVGKYEDWNAAPSHDIEVAMTCIAPWEKQTKELQELVWSIKRDTDIYRSARPWSTR